MTEQEGFTWQARMWDQTAWRLDVELLSLRKHEQEISAV